METALENEIFNICNIVLEVTMRDGNSISSSSSQPSLRTVLEVTMRDGN